MPHKPKYLPTEEVKRIAAAGRIKHRAAGNLISFDGPIAGGRQPRKERIRCRELTTDAATFLVLGDLDSWYDCLLELAPLIKKRVGKPADWVQLCQGIELTALACGADPNISKYAQLYMQARRPMYPRAKERKPLALVAKKPGVITRFGRWWKSQSTPGW